MILTDKKPPTNKIELGFISSTAVMITDKSF